MSKRTVLGLSALLALVSMSVSAADADQRLRELFAAEWERGLREDPLDASSQGDHRFDHLLPDLSAEAIEASKVADRAALTALKAIDADQLSVNERLNYRVFEWQLQQRIAGQQFPEEWIPISQQGGIQTFDVFAEQLRFKTVKDYENWIARLRGFDRYVGQTIDLLKQGVKAGFTPPRVVMQRVSGQLERQLAKQAEQSRFWAVFEAMPAAITSAEQVRLRAEAKQAIESVVLPAYRELKTYFDEVYLPACREGIAAADYPNGRDYYAYLARFFTTTDLSPEAIHQIGLDEVARIRAEMEQIKAKVGFEGDLAAFFNHLRTDPKFFYKTPEELLTAYQAMAKRIDPELVKVFRTLPRLTYGVRAIPDSLAPDTYTAYYQPGAADGSRAGYYYVNLYKPEARPKWEMMALSLHESVPGHHFQFALGLELPEQPMFRKTAYIVAYGEGWALYAERLGHQMGLYDDPYDHFGQLTYDMWRAVRLVVDTGMHVKGWSRQQAIDYFMANAPKTEQDVVNEIDRYIAWPGQALAYKIGQLKILELRAKAEGALGERFDLRDFNDAVLATGSVPLAVLEAQINDWLTEQVKGAP